MVLAELLEKGGAVMAILLLLSVYVFSVIFYKLFQLWRAQAIGGGFNRKLLSLIENKKFQEALNLTSSYKSPVAKVAQTALQLAGQNKTQEQRIKAIEASGTKEIRNFESHLRGLEMVANIAPLLGLLGTVIGMVKAFAGIHEIGSRVDPSVLAGGIWEALLTTVAGLAVAIPALAAHYIIDGKLENIRSIMKESTSNILAQSKM